MSHIDLANDLERVVRRVARVTDDLVPEKVYALWGNFSQTWITYNGLVIIHSNREEMEWLLPGTGTVKPFPKGAKMSECLWLAQHPSIVGADITFPLNKDDFVDHARSKHG